jgi:hypothetical protein
VLKEEGFVMPSKPESAPVLTNETARAWLIQHVADRFSLDGDTAKAKIKTWQDERNAETKAHLLEYGKSIPGGIPDSVTRELEVIDHEDSSALIVSLVRTGQREFYLEGERLCDRWV